MRCDAAHGQRGNADSEYDSEEAGYTIQHLYLVDTIS